MKWLICLVAVLFAVATSEAGQKARCRLVSRCGSIAPAPVAGVPVSTGTVVSRSVSTSQQVCVGGQCHKSRSVNVQVSK